MEAENLKTELTKLFQDLGNQSIERLKMCGGLYWGKEIKEGFLICKLSSEKSCVQSLYS